MAKSNYYRLPVSVKYLWKLYYTARERRLVEFKEPEKNYDHAFKNTWCTSYIYIKDEKLHIIAKSFNIGIKKLGNTHKKYKLRPQLEEWFEQVQWTHEKYLEEHNNV